MMRTLTALEFANQLPSEKALTTRAIQEGRLRVVSPGEKGTSKEKPARTPEPLERLKEKQVRLSIVGGTILEGTLREVSRFEVVLSTGGRSLIILKHAILCCEELKAPGAG